MNRLFGRFDKSSKRDNLPLRSGRPGDSSRAAPVQDQYVRCEAVNREIWNYLNREASSFTRAGGSGVAFDGFKVWQPFSSSSIAEYIRHGGYTARPLEPRDRDTFFIMIGPSQQKHRRDVSLGSVPAHRVHVPVPVYGGMDHALQKLWDYELIPFYDQGLRMKGPFRPRVSTDRGHIDDGASVPIHFSSIPGQPAINLDQVSNPETYTTTGSGRGNIVHREHNRLVRRSDGRKHRRRPSKERTNADLKKNGWEKGKSLHESQSR